MDKQHTVRQIEEWFNAHATEYVETARRLGHTKGKFLAAKKSVQYDMLKKSYVNAVMSQQTQVSRHEEAYTEWISGKSLKESLQLVNYHNQKFDWITRTDISHYFEVISLLEDGQVRKAHKHMTSEFTGLGPMKAAFTLAMLGFTEVMCLDTNVQQLTDIKCRTKSINKYTELCNDVLEDFNELNLSPFMWQWVAFDCMRGEHSTHKVWFKSLDTWGKEATA